MVIYVEPRSVAGPNASVELSRHVGFTPDFGRMVATQRTDASGQEETSCSFNLPARKFAVSRISFAAACVSCATAPDAAAQLFTGLRERRQLGEHAQSPPHHGARPEKRDPDRPGCERSHRKADHHCFDDLIGV